MTRRQNLQYNISNEQKMKNDDEYVLKSNQIKLEMSVEKGTKEVKNFQDLHMKHSQVIAKFQLKLKYFVIEARDLNIIEKKKFAIISFVESFTNISEEFLSYDDRKDINEYLCYINVIKLYSHHLAVHLDDSKEGILEEYKKKYELDEMPRSHITRPLAASPAAAPPDHPDCPESFGEQTRRLLNERAAVAMSTDDTRMVIVKNIPAEAEPPPQPDTFVDAEFCIKLKATLEIIFVLVWGASCKNTSSVS